MANNLIIEDTLAAWIEALPAAVDVAAKCHPWAKAPQNTATRPFVLYKRISGGRIRSLTGPSGVSHPRIQLSVFGRDYTAVRDLAHAIRLALDSFSTTQSGNLMGDRTVQVGMVHDDFDGTDEEDARPQHGTELAEHRFNLDATIWFVE